MDGFDWNRTLREQWEFHREHQLRDRLAGLTDEETQLDVWLAGVRDLYRHLNGATR